MRPVKNTLLVLSLLAAGCGSSGAPGNAPDSSTPAPSDASPSGTTPSDAGADGDASEEVSTDSGLEAASDGGADGGADGGLVTPADAGAEGGLVSSSDSGTDGASSSIDSGADAASPSYPTYANTSTQLFSFDTAAPQTAPVLVGTFDCIGGTNQDTVMTDLAVDKGQNLWGISAKSVYALTVSGNTVHCSQTTALTPSPSVAFTGLSLAPVGVLDPSLEVLVTLNVAGEVWSIAADGALTLHGTLGTVPANDGHGHAYANAGKAWEASGDLVFVANGGSPLGFAMVRDCSAPPSTGCDAVDTLVEIDLSALRTAGTQVVTKSLRGQVVKSAGCSDPANTGYGNFFGITASGSSAFGFAHAQGIVQVSLADGTGCLTTATPSDLWSGAGVTTLSPVTPPPAL